MSVRPRNGHSALSFVKKRGKKGKVLLSGGDRFLIPEEKDEEALDFVHFIIFFLSFFLLR